MKTKFKSARTTKEYKVTYGRLKYEITVPVGSLVTNSTACWFDDAYHFLSGVPAKVLVGYDAGMLAHDLRYYGLNIPAEYCEPYPQ